MSVSNPVNVSPQVPVSSKDLSDKETAFKLVQEEAK